MKVCSIDEIKEYDVLARDIMADNYNVFLYKNTILSRKYIDKLKQMGIKTVYIKDNIPQEEVSVLKKEIEQQSKRRVKEILRKHTYNNSKMLEEIKDTVENIINNILESEEVVETIYDIKARSADVYTHSINICVLATVVSLKLGLNKQQIQDIGVGCLLHDVGLRYMMIEYQEQDIETLSSKELIEYKKHPVYGYSALKNENWLSNKSKEIVLCHHEKINGSGFPLHAKDISLETKIVSTCDTFDELICGIGCKRMKIYEAVEYLKGFKNILFDDRIVDALLDFVAVYPAGSVVVTNENEIAVVLRQNKSFHERPVIQIIKDKNGNPVKEEKIIDLVKVNNIFIDSVLE